MQVLQPPSLDLLAGRLDSQLPCGAVLSPSGAAGPSGQFGSASSCGGSAVVRLPERGGAAARQAFESIPRGQTVQFQGGSRAVQAAPPCSGATSSGGWTPSRPASYGSPLRSAYDSASVGHATSMQGPPQSPFPGKEPPQQLQPAATVGGPVTTVHRADVCPSCGNVYMLDSNFCRKCGRRRDSMAIVEHPREQVVEYHERQVGVAVQLTKEQIVEVPEITQIDFAKEVPRQELQQVPKPVEKPEVQLVERVIEVPWVEYQERIVEVPQVEYREVVRQAPKYEVRYIDKHVPKAIVEYVEKIIEVPHIVQQERVIEVPQVEYCEVVKEVKVPVPHLVGKHIPKPVMNYFEKVIEEPVVLRHEVPVEIPHVIHVETVTQVAKPMYEDVMVQLPRERQTPEDQRQVANTEASAATRTVVGPPPQIEAHSVAELPAQAMQLPTSGANPPKVFAQAMGTAAVGDDILPLPPPSQHALPVTAFHNSMTGPVGLTMATVQTGGVGMAGAVVPDPFQPIPLPPSQQVLPVTVFHDSMTGPAGPPMAAGFAVPESSFQHIPPSHMQVLPQTTVQTGGVGTAGAVSPDAFQQIPPPQQPQVLPLTSLQTRTGAVVPDALLPPPGPVPSSFQEIPPPPQPAVLPQTIMQGVASADPVGLPMASIQAAPLTGLQWQRQSQGTGQAAMPVTEHFAQQSMATGHAVISMEQLAQLAAGRQATIQTSQLPQHQALAAELAAQTQMLQVPGGEVQSQLLPGTAGTQALRGVTGTLQGYGTQMLQASASTQMCQGGIETQMLPGDQGAQVLQGSAGTQMLPGATGTQMPPAATGTQMLPGFASTQMLPGGYGTQFEQPSPLRQGFPGTQLLHGGVETQMVSSVHGIQMLHGSPGTRMLPGAGSTPMLPGAASTQMLQGSPATQMLQGAFGTQMLQGGVETQMVQGAAGTQMLLDVTGTQMLQGDARLQMQPSGAEMQILHGGAVTQILPDASGTHVLPSAASTQMLPGGFGTQFVQGSAGPLLQVSPGTQMLPADAEAQMLHGAPGTQMLRGVGGPEVSSLQPVAPTQMLDVTQQEVSQQDLPAQAPRDRGFLEGLFDDLARA